MSAPLSKDEIFVLEWLTKEDFSLLGECKGAALAGLVGRGFAHIGPIPVGRTDPNYRLASLTDAGWSAFKELPA